jgi:hypothetical protein
VLPNTRANITYHVANVTRSRASPDWVPVLTDLTALVNARRDGETDHEFE